MSRGAAATAHKPAEYFHLWTRQSGWGGSWVNCIRCECYKVAMKDCMSAEIELNPLSVHFQRLSTVFFVKCTDPWQCKCAIAFGLQCRSSWVQCPPQAFLIQVIIGTAFSYLSIFTSWQISKPFTLLCYLLLPNNSHQHKSRANRLKRTKRTVFHELFLTFQSHNRSLTRWAINNVIRIYLFCHILLCLHKDRIQVFLGTILPSISSNIA